MNNIFIKKNKDFDLIILKKNKKTSDKFIVFYKKNELNINRFGISISKKNINLAVNRNKIKRQIKNILRKNAKNFYNHTIKQDFVIIIKKNYINEVNFSFKEKELVNLINSLLISNDKHN